MKRIFVAIFVLALVIAVGHSAWALELAYKHDPVMEFEGFQASATTAIVTFTPSFSLKKIVREVESIGFTVESFSTQDGMAYRPAELLKVRGMISADLSHTVVRFEDLSLEDALRILCETPGVTEVTPNWVHQLYWTPNDPYYAGYQGNFRQIYVDKAWGSVSGTNVTVAVIDTGIRKTGMKDSPVTILAGYNFYLNNTDTTDHLAHGTHVSNTIAEHTNNAVGMAGIAYNAKILPLKVFPDNGGGAYESDIIDAINYATSHGANVINMSLGGSGYSAQTDAAITNAYNHNVLPFAASGNDGKATVSYPAAYTNCVAVGSVKQHAVGAAAVRSTFSNYGTALDIVAPGENIAQETFDPNTGVVGYYYMSGTSMACPHAVAVAALLVSHAGANAAKIRAAILTTAHNPAGAGKWTNTLGYGEIDAYQALQHY
jgi:subtilisin family serine protease